MERVKVEETEKVEPAPLEVALLYKILKAQRQTLEFLKSVTAEGIDIPLEEQTVTGVVFVDLIREYPYRSLRSIDFFNKGPDTAYFRINEEEKEIPIENREHMTVERPRPTIEHVTLRVDAGNTAVLKLVGHY